ncbi:hypothetical protein [Chryseobacterium sp. Leaf180]|jgi:flagellar basal body-associated protein FliL|uniref:hypothetical protein n=1 Tax=Chryseobacterium sp. Leaf180 TaxID=1736289 RepID=UPI000AD84845|nr:hypothetical protein [Chryseobacterium sp. Leaf180]
MEPTAKNKPNKLVIVLFSMIVLLIVAYFFIVMFFPALAEGLTLGTIKPTTPDK